MIPVGVPEIAPVDASKVRPIGSAGETDHEVTAPPLEVGVIGHSIKLKELHDSVTVIFF